MKAKTLVVGIGSPVVCDDAIGFRIIEELRKMDLEDVDLDDISASGLDMIEIMMDYQRVIVVDAIITGDYLPGTVMVLEDKDFSGAIHGTNPHEVNMHTAIELGRRLQPERMPKDIRFVAVEVKDVWTITDRMTSEVETALPKAVRVILDMISEV